MRTYNLQLKTYERRTKDFVRGQSMIEMLVAISIISVSLVGILALVGRSIALNRLTTEQYVATYLAAEGIELVKNLFDHSYLVSSGGGFYGWSGTDGISSGTYFIDFNDTGLSGISGGLCSFVPPLTEARVANFFKNCGASLPYLNFDSVNGYSYALSGTPTKFRRVIIIDEPAEGNPVTVGFPTLDLRVTSAVGWKSRGGEFVVQLQNHFLPWRIP